MTTLIADLLVALATYLALGLLLSPWVALRLVDRLDPAAAGAGWGFRLVILPGIWLLWPLLCWRWWRRRVLAAGAGR